MNSIQSKAQFITSIHPLNCYGQSYGLCYGLLISRSCRPYTKIANNPDFWTNLSNINNQKIINNAILIQKSFKFHSVSLLRHLRKIVADAATKVHFSISTIVRNKPLEFLLTNSPLFLWFLSCLTACRYLQIFQLSLRVKV